MDIERISVIGSGAWGTALAQMLSFSNRRILLWARESGVVEDINKFKRNELFLPGIKLASNLNATNDLADAAKADLILLVVPAQYARSVLEELSLFVSPNTPTLICTKGIEIGTSALMSEVLVEILPTSLVAVMSGPAFAGEVAKGLPTAVTLACKDEMLGRTIMHTIGSIHFRPYLSGDVIGSQIGGALKNVIAIACGIVEGRQLGDNARAATMTRGLMEMIRYGNARGGEANTLLGLSGLGDLTLTCNSIKSRNMSLGVEIGNGRNIKDILSERNSVAEGAYTVAALSNPDNPHFVEMPICQAVDRIINKGEDISVVIEDLLSRPFKTENI